MTDLEAAWTAIHEYTPEGWFVGQPMEHPERNEWSQFAFDPSETPAVGKRSREWTAIGRNELRCVQEMARCLGTDATRPPTPSEHRDSRLNYVRTRQRGYPQRCPVKKLGRCLVTKPPAAAIP